MKKGRIILSAAALVVTAGSTLAFKIVNHVRLTGNHQLHATAGNGCSLSNCHTTDAGTVAKSSCKTSGGTVATKLFTTASCVSHTWTKQVTVTGR
jgi:hypothetical protein